MLTHYENNRGQWDLITNPGKMRPIRMVRGHYNKFYYVETDQNYSYDLIYVLKLEKPEN